MIKKEELLEGLKKIICAEEGMITLSVNISKVLLSHVDEIDEDKKKEISKLLSVLYRDSARHKESMDGLVLQIEGSENNEY